MISGFSLIIKVTSLYLSHKKRRENINEQQNKDVYFWKKSLALITAPIDQNPILVRWAASKIVMSAK